MNEYVNIGDVYNIHTDDAARQWEILFLLLCQLFVGNLWLQGDNFSGESATG